MSLIICFGNIVLNDIILAVLSWPYLSLTYSITLSLLVLSKSISISGIVILSGFKNLSNIKLYLRGSTLIIPKL